jgi:hypothetical protein
MQFCMVVRVQICLQNSAGQQLGWGVLVALLLGVRVLLVKVGGGQDGCSGEEGRGQGQVVWISASPFGLTDFLKMQPVEPCGEAVGSGLHCY